MQACERKKSKKIKTVRADSAAYQADAAVKAAIAAIPEGEWKTFRDGEIAETVHCMNKTDKAF